MMGVMGVNAIRETFREADCVRFHPIINSGGDLVNVIPDRVTIILQYLHCKINIIFGLKYAKSVCY